MPVAEKAPPLALTWPMVVSVLPLLVKVTMLVLLDPVFTVPKAIRGVSWPCAMAEFAAIKRNKEVLTRTATTRIRLIWFYLPSCCGITGLRMENGTSTKNAVASKCLIGYRLCNG
jgi:hypothetical protein